MQSAGEKLSSWETDELTETILHIIYRQSM